MKDEGRRRGCMERGRTGEEERKQMRRLRFSTKGCHGKYAYQSWRVDLACKVYSASSSPQSESFLSRSTQHESQFDETVMDAYCK